MSAAYRLAPDTPAEIARDLARLCVGSGRLVSAMGNPMAVEAGNPASTPRDSAEGGIAHFRSRISALGTDSAPKGIAVARAQGTTPSPSAVNGLGPKDGAESTALASASPAAAGPALFGGVAALLAPPPARPAAAADIDIPTSTDALPCGPLTLAQAEALDFVTLWRSLPGEAQVRIGALALQNETMLQLVEDGGFHTTPDDREDAQSHADRALDALRPAIWAALPAVMPTVYDEPYPLFQVLGGRDAPAEVDVRGLGLRSLVPGRYEQWFARDGERLLELGGAVDLDSRIPGAPSRWQFWTASDIDAERLQRHPEMAGGIA